MGLSTIVLLSRETQKKFLIADAARRGFDPVFFSVPVPRCISLCFAPLNDLDCATFVALSVLLRSFTEDFLDWFLCTEIEAKIDLPLTRELQRIVRFLHGSSDLSAGGPFIDVLAVQVALSAFSLGTGTHDLKTGQDPHDLWEAFCSVLHTESDRLAAQSGGSRCCVTEDGRHSGTVDSYCVGERFLSLLGLKGQCSVSGCGRPVKPGIGIGSSPWCAFDGSTEQRLVMEEIRLVSQQIPDPFVLTLGSTRSIELVVSVVDGYFDYLVVTPFHFV